MKNQVLICTAADMTGVWILDDGPVLGEQAQFNAHSLVHSTTWKSFQVTVWSRRTSEPWILSWVPKKKRVSRDVEQRGTRDPGRRTNTSR